MTDAPDETLKVAKDLREIRELSLDLFAQAVTNAASSEMPGGTAMAMMAPVASPEARDNRVDGSMRWNLHVEDTELRLQPRDLSHLADDEGDNWEPPLQTLLFWSEQWRIQHGRESDRRPTIGSESLFLVSLIDWAWENEEHWADFAKDVKTARTRLENTLKAGDRAERTRVPCLDCDDPPKLIKVYEDVAIRDHYKCPRCKRRYDPESYLRAKAQHLDSQGAARYVRVQDAKSAIDRPEGTFRKWMRDGRIQSYCDSKTRQTWVFWPDVREMDLATKKRRRSV